MRSWLVTPIAMAGFAVIMAAANAADLAADAAALPPATGDYGPSGAVRQAATNAAYEPAQDAGSGQIAAAPWTAFHEFLFDFDRADIQAADKTKIAEIAAFMAENPAMRLGIDGATDPKGNGLHNKTLIDRRIAAVRDALIRAGVPAERIHLGEFADPRLRRDRQVEVVLGGGPQPQ